MIEKLNDKDATKEERQEATKQLLSDMSPENAELLSSMTTPSMMMQYGSSEEKADIISDSVATLFNNMAAFQPDTDSEEGQAQYDAEAEAVNTILQLAMDGSNSDSDALFSSESGEDSRTGRTAGEFVELLVNSEVVGETLIDTVYENGNAENPFGVTASEDDQVVLSEEINSYYEANKDNGDERLTMKLNAVAVIVGMEPIFDIEQ